MEVITLITKVGCFGGLVPLVGREHCCVRLARSG